MWRLINRKMSGIRPITHQLYLRNVLDLNCRLMMTLPCVVFPVPSRAARTLPSTDPTCGTTRRHIQARSHTLATGLPALCALCRRINWSSIFDHTLANAPTVAPGQAVLPPSGTSLWLLLFCINFKPYNWLLKSETRTQVSHVDSLWRKTIQVWLSWVRLVFSSQGSSDGSQASYSREWQEACLRLA